MLPSAPETEALLRAADDRLELLGAVQTEAALLQQWRRLLTVDARRAVEYGAVLVARLGNPAVREAACCSVVVLTSVRIPFARLDACGCS